MAQRPVLRFASRGWRDLPSPSTRVRGAGDLPYNPRRPLTLPGSRHRRRRPQLRGESILRLLLPILALAGLGVGVFFGVSALLDSDDPAPATDAPATDATATATDAATADAATEGTTGNTAEGTADSTAGGTAGDTADNTAEGATPIDSDAPAVTADQSAQAEAPAAGDTDAAAVPTSPDVVTEAALSGAPAVLDRGGATPIPSGITGLTLADGTLYNPADETAALSSVWPAGTVLDITRLPGGPLLTDDDAAELIGKTIQVIVVGNGEFPTELQLSPAAYQRIARDFEPIIALRIVAVAAPE